MADWRPRHSFQKGIDARRGSRNYTPKNNPLRVTYLGKIPFEKEESSAEKIYIPGCDADKEAIFNFPFIVNEDTVSFIKNHGRIMFIVRGPPSTGKATLSEMIIERYPSSVYCCADRYFHNSFSTPDRSRENIRASHLYCQKKAETACSKNESPILVQNTHMRKWEMQKYIDLATEYNYTVIMAITLYRYHIVTPEVLERNNTDGLDINYFKNRLRQWEDVPPYLTGFFICPKDTLYLLNQVQTSLKALLNDGKFCRIFDMYDADNIVDYFVARKLLYCLAGYTKKSEKMNSYYLNDVVQECYGKSYKANVQGFIVSLTGVTGVVSIEEDIKGLLLNEENDIEKWSIDKRLDSLALNENLLQHYAALEFDHENFTSGKTVTLEPWDQEHIRVKDCCLIHLAKKRNTVFDVNQMRKDFYDSLAALSSDDCQFSELENDIKVCRLPNNEWFIKIPQKIKMSTLFTGLYI